MPRPLSIAIAAVLGCGGAGEERALPDAGPPLPLAECVVGAWAWSTECACDFDPNPEGRTPECDQADCLQWRATVIADGGDYSTFPLLASETAGTASIPYGCMQVFHASWSIAGGELVLQFTSTDVRGATSCDGEELRHMPTGRWSRAPDRLVPVLVALSVADVSTDTCQGVPY